MDESPQTRLCADCGETKPFTLQMWYANRGKPVGKVCRLCMKSRKRLLKSRERKVRVAARQAAHEAGIQTAPNPPAGKPATAVSTYPDRLPGELPRRQLEIAQALHEGAGVLNRNARRVLARVLHYATDPSSPNHDWALKMLAERIMPSKLFTEIGAQAAGIKTGQGSVRPAVNISITIAGQDAGGKVVATVAEDAVPVDAAKFKDLW